MSSYVRSLRAQRKNRKEGYWFVQHVKGRAKQNPVPWYTEVHASSEFSIRTVSKDDGFYSPYSAHEAKPFILLLSLDVRSLWPLRMDRKRG